MSTFHLIVDVPEVFMCFTRLFILTFKGSPHIALYNLKMLLKYTFPRGESMIGVMIGIITRGRGY